MFFMLLFLFCSFLKKRFLQSQLNFLFISLFFCSFSTVPSLYNHLLLCFTSFVELELPLYMKIAFRTSRGKRVTLFFLVNLCVPSLSVLFLYWVSPAATHGTMKHWKPRATVVVRKLLSLTPFLEVTADHLTISQDSRARSHVLLSG